MSNGLRVSGNAVKWLEGQQLSGDQWAGRLSWNVTSRGRQPLTCVCRPAGQLAFLLPILGHDGLREVKEILQWAAVRAARQDQWPGSLVTLIPKVHLH